MGQPADKAWSDSEAKDPGFLHGPRVGLKGQTEFTGLEKFLVHGTDYAFSRGAPRRRGRSDSYAGPRP